MQEVPEILSGASQELRDVPRWESQKPRDLENTYGGRIIDRIKSSCFYLEFNGASERKPLNLEDI